MREHKYRGKTFSGEWVYGNLAVLRQTIRNVERGTYISNDAGMPFAYRVIPETIGQYTGLKDKNGKEIYEDDIVRCWFFGEEYIRLIEWVGYEAGFTAGFRFDLGKLDGTSDVEIIGNIHENPKLLDVEP